ncbi:NB-ARC domain-containing protein [Streptomyces sp. SID14515]|uniref:NB-ARC domain-containing protein n=1 Tax=Streptomyces sp. SID14515 TaxID=2706074 RepID=UPI0013C707DB|nr:NB-ARC domain-containing protein [Streptomyces sp. SID14515]NEB39248.1 hypothetical protein [Streptomyces sp. SID14515]
MGDRAVHGGITFDIQQPPRPELNLPPDEIPPPPARFVGRAASLAALDTWLAQGDSDGVGVGFVALYGPPGVGKTALVSHWVERRRERFPGGRIYVDFAALRAEAADEEVFETARRRLRSQGVDVACISATFTERIELLRSRFEGGRLVVFLDNVSCAAEVTPLIPLVEGQGSVLLVASENHLGELALDGARSMPVDPLDRDSSLAVLADRCGAERVAVDPASAERLVDLCGGLPMVLRVVAARLATDARLSFAALATELAMELRRPTGVPALGREGSVSAAFDLSYRGLDPDTARLYRLMSWFPGESFDAGVAAVAAELDPNRAADALESLDRAGLLDRMADGRLRFHRLVRLHALERGTEEEHPDEFPALVMRVTLHYLALTALADRTVRLDRLRIADLDQWLSDVHDPFAAPDAPQPVDWLEAEHRNILGVLRAAARDRALYTEVWQLVEALTALFFYHRHLGAWRDSLLIGVGAASVKGTRAAEARLLSFLSRVLMDLGDHIGARLAMDRALVWAQKASDDVLLASVLEFRGRCLEPFSREDAKQSYRRSIFLNKRANQPRGEAIATYLLGCVQAADNELYEALFTLRGSRAALSDVCDRRMAARVDLAIGMVLGRLGEAVEADQLLRRSAETLLAVKAMYYRAEALVALADLQERWEGPFSDVRSLIVQSIAIFDVYDSPRAAVLRRRLANMDPRD